MFVILWIQKDPCEQKLAFSLALVEDPNVVLISPQCMLRHLGESDLSHVLESSGCGPDTYDYLPMKHFVAHVQRSTFVNYNTAGEKQIPPYDIYDLSSEAFAYMRVCAYLPVAADAILCTEANERKNAEIKKNNKLKSVERKTEPLPELKYGSGALPASACKDVKAWRKDPKSFADTVGWACIETDAPVSAKTKSTFSADAFEKYMKEAERMIAETIKYLRQNKDWIAERIKDPHCRIDVRSKTVTKFLSRMDRFILLPTQTLSRPEFPPVAPTHDTAALEEKDASE